MQTLLPLSWARAHVTRPDYRDVTLPFSRIRWITFADIPHDYSLEVIYKDLKLSYPEGFVIRGCSIPMAEYFASGIGQTVKTGAEAVLDLQGTHLEHPSVAGPAGRALKRGSVVEVEMDEASRKKLELFRKETRHAGKPQLQYVFRAKPSSACRCFVFKSDSGEWLAVMTLSGRGTMEVHTEVMLKRHDASADIMEGLIAGIYKILRAEGIREWSLGEVPFAMLMQSSEELLAPLERLMVSMTSLWKHAYDFEGLYRFKNKFKPEWRPVMLCSNSELSPLMLAELAITMGFTDLMLHESGALLKKWLMPGGGTRP
jgi:hypothetical protein